MSRIVNPKGFDRLRETASRNRRVLVPIAVGVGLGALGLVLLVPRQAKAKAGRPRAMDPEELGLEKIKGRQHVQRYLAKAEAVSGIRGLATFGLAASKRESGFNNLSANKSPSEAAAACDAYDFQRTRELEDSPYNEPEYFCWGTGGWFGQMPAYALARDPFQHLNPIWAVHDPATSTAMFTATIARLIKAYFPDLPPEHRNWLALRRSMASLKTFYDYKEEGERAPAVRERLTKDLAAIGVDPSFMYERPSASNYPGNAVVWDALRKIEPSVSATT